MKFPPVVLKQPISSPHEIEAELQAENQKLRDEVRPAVLCRGEKFVRRAAHLDFRTTVHGTFCLF
jgi:hypothetical protein